MTFPMFSDLTVGEEAALSVLHSIPGWPIDYDTDRNMLHRLSDVYPAVSVEEEAVKFQLWLTEHSQKKKIKYRARFAVWMGKSYEYSQKRSGRSDRAHQAAEIEGHGESGSISQEW